MTTQPTLSVVVPLFNEQASIKLFHKSLTSILKTLPVSYEVIYCNDGSTDSTLELVRTIAGKDASVRFLSLSRNFGKELAVTAGIHAAKGDAILTLDADGQHPVTRIPEFISAWQSGARVVVGVRTANTDQSVIKGFGSKSFYKLFNRFSGAKLVPGSTDFRLIDKTVQRDFITLTERNRITRGLIDWLGYEQTHITFTADKRIAGEATYSIGRLLKLSVDSVVSLSVSPLYIVAYIGIFVLPLSLLLGVGMAMNALLSDPLHIHATGSAYIAVLTLCLVGILMVSQGIIGLYLSHIHAETQNRPLYVIDESKSNSNG